MVKIFHEISGNLLTISARTWFVQICITQVLLKNFLHINGTSSVYNHNAKQCNEKYWLTKDTKFSDKTAFKLQFLFSHHDRLINSSS